jgi:APA family basic amino acid/polyamine antiporter
MTVVPATRPLGRILGLGFGLAIAFGGTVGVGILRLPGVVAGALGDPALIMLFWAVGGVYALLGAVAVAELATMFPEAGGFRVYARRAFGETIGFVIGWCDWLCNVSSLAFGAITAATFLGVLWAPTAEYSQVLALAIIAVFTALHWIGIRIGSTMTSVISLTVGAMLLLLVIGCFLVAPMPAGASAPLPDTAASVPLGSMAMLVALVTALRSVLVTFDGWYAPIYMAEESAEPARTLPRALIGGTLLVAVFYLLINAAFLRVVPLPVLATSSLPAADAARALLSEGGAQVVTLISLLTVLSLVNAVMLMTPRILLAIGRDGYLPARAADVSASGTPRVALGISSLFAAALIATGTFEQIVALSAVLFTLYYVSAYAALIVLRYRDSSRLRPYRAFGFPYTTAVVLLGSLLFLTAALVEDSRSALTAGVFVALCAVWHIGASRRRAKKGHDDS